MQPAKELTTSRRIYGQVKAAEGASRATPLKDVAVKLTSADGVTQDETKTDADGGYEFRAGTGSYFVETPATVKHKGKSYVGPAEKLSIEITSSDKEKELPVILYTVEQQPRTGDLVVIATCDLIDLGPLRVRDVPVTVAGTSKATDVTGEARFSLQAGRYAIGLEPEIKLGKILAKLTSEEQLTRDVAAGQTTTLDVRYAQVEQSPAPGEKGHIVGHVYRVEGSRLYPLAGVQVFLKSPVAMLESTDTEDDGSYEFFAAEGDYLVDAVSRAGDANRPLTLVPGSGNVPVHVGPGTGDTPVANILYERETSGSPETAFGVLHVSTVVDESALAAKGTATVPAGEVPFRVTPQGRASGRTYRTKGNGEINLVLPEGMYHIDFDPDLFVHGYPKPLKIVTGQHATKEVNADETTYVEAVYAAENGRADETGPASIIRGTVLFQSAAGSKLSKAIPLAGLEVSLHEADGPEIDSAITDNQGEFEFARNLRPGDYELHLPEEFDSSPIRAISAPMLRLADRRFQSIDVSIDFEGDEPEVGPIIYIPRAAGVEGVITPLVEGIPVALINLVTQERLTTATDPQGYYHFDQPQPGTYALRLENLLPDKGLRLKAPPSGSFSAGPGKLIERNFEYVEVGGHIHGYVFLNFDGTAIRSVVNPPIPDVYVELSDESGKTIELQKTGANGEYFFTNVPPGKYLLEFRRLVSDTLGRFDENYELESSPVQPVDVRANESVEAKPVSYTLEQHQVIGRVVYRRSKKPIANVTVILCDEKGDEIARQRTGSDGRYRFRNVRGRVKIKLPEVPSGSPLISASTIEGLVNSTWDAGDQEYDDEPGGFSQGAAIIGATAPPFGGSIQDAIQDIASYMPTSQEVSPAAPYSTQYRTGGGTATGDLQGLVNSALVHVLGRKGDVRDGKAFLGSLERAFTIKETNGKQTLEWTPRTYAVETELGGKISGAQASLYHLAKSALDDALPLLAGINPLLPDFDPETSDAVRKIVRTEFSEVVEALGAEGGPVIQRVDDLFVSVERALDRMQEEFGLRNDRVNTVEEESNLTNFLVVRDYVSSLQSTWQAQRGNIAGFLGTKLVLLSRALSSVVESVTETEDAMDSVFLGPAERQTVRIDFPLFVTVGDRIEAILRDANGNAIQAPSILVGELLGWVLRFARDEGPALIRDGGRIGVASMQPTAERLRKLVLGAIEAPVPHVGFTRNRVKRALSELAAQVGYVAVLATELADVAAAQRKLAAAQ